jgi:alpha-tubulin suppressor-like RCC1 family protein
MAAAALPAATFTSTGDLLTARWNHSANLLSDGQVLVAGGENSSALASAELYDPATGLWSATVGTLGTARRSHTGTLLADGTILVVGGRSSGNSPHSSAERYDPSTGLWSTTGALSTARYSHSATRLADGTVLVVGGFQFSRLSTSELFDPVAGSWSPTNNNLTFSRSSHTATLLSDGRVLVTGGNGGGVQNSAELYDPATKTWSLANSMSNGRENHTASLLADGTVLIVGGYSGTNTEIYAPATGLWASAVGLSPERSRATATLLPDGRVLVAGGLKGGSNYLDNADLYNASTLQWSATADSLLTGRADHTATLLADGRLLLAGGRNGGSNALASAELTAVGLLPEIVVEEPLGNAISDGGARDFGSIFVGAGATRVFTIKNTGAGDLIGLALTVDGTDASDFSVTASPASSLNGPAGSTSFAIRFSPSSVGAKTASLHLASNDADENPFDIALSGTGTSSALSATYADGTEVPLTVESFTATGNTVAFALDFVPDAGTTLMVVNNTGTEYIEGAFSNLAPGDTVRLTYENIPYDFVAWYFGGDGNDLVLRWAHYGIAGIYRHLPPVPTAPSGYGALAGKTVGEISMHQTHILALTVDGTLAAWGNNTSGQLGTGNYSSADTPTAVVFTAASALGGKTVVDAVAGISFSLALFADGTVAAWGDNEFGQLGDGSTTDSNFPVQVAKTGALVGRTPIAIAAGLGHGLALCSDGALVVWGNNEIGQFGIGSTAPQSVPGLVYQGGALAGKTVVAIAAGQGHSLALCSDGSLVAWGGNNAGQLGNAGVPVGNGEFSSVPVLVDQTGALAGKTVTAIAASIYNSMALCADGSLATWGANNSGQLGNGDSPVASPIPIAVNTDAGISALAGKTVVEIDIGSGSSIVLCADGSVVGLGGGWDLPVALDLTGLLAGKQVEMPRVGPSLAAGLILFPISYEDDFDADGLNDLSEFYLGELGFDWLVGQPDLVETYYAAATGASLFNQALYDANRQAGRDEILNDPNASSLFTLSQVQALHVDATLVAKDPITDLFTLTLGVEKSTDLEAYDPLPMTLPQILVNASGELEFEFSVPDNAAFFRVEAK